MVDIPRKVTRVLFTLLSPEELEKLSVVEVTESDTIENGRPVSNGLFDLRMGINDMDERCLTCNFDAAKCQGHLGHINLAVPIYNLSLMKNIKQILEVICVGCSKILLKNPNTKHLPAQLRIHKLNASLPQAPKRFCEHCGLIQPKIQGITKSDVILKYETVNTEGNKLEHELLAEDIYIKFKRLNNQDIEALGFDNINSHPSNMILTKFPVLPPSTRPATKNENNQRAEHDLTVAYVAIVKENRKLKHKIEAEPNNRNIANLANDLAVAIGSLMDSSIKTSIKNISLTGISKKHGTSIKDLITTKHGQIRGNLMGKRVNNSARTVIGGDPFLDLDQVGVPYMIARNMTVPEVVTKYNMKRLYAAILNGPNKINGAKSYKDSNNKFSEKRLEYIDPAQIVLKEGDIVHRHMSNDDINLFNRQPSLHKLSMMGHKARITTHNKTLTFNVSGTKPYNADFDGDEMNIHLPQTSVTMEELNQLCLITRHIVSPQSSLTSIGMVQEGLVGTYLLTNNLTQINKSDFNTLMMCNRFFNGFVPNSTNNNNPNVNEIYSGRDVLTAIMPKVNMIKGVGSNRIMISDGVMISGELSSDQLAHKKTNSIIHVIKNDHGYNLAGKFVSALQRIASYYLIKKGLTFSLRDITIDQNIIDQIKDLLIHSEHVVNINKKIEEVLNNKFVSPIGSTNKKHLEVEIINEITGINNTIENLVDKNLYPDNGLKHMVTSGAKGSKLNINLITGIIGQQIIGMERVQKLYGDRCLPHFCKYDDSPFGRGFIPNNFYNGIGPLEFLFHLISGRDGAIDTAINTADSGYISRKIMKFLEDIRVNYNYTVTNAGNQIIQFVYADDALDPINLERQCFETVTMSDLDINNMFNINYNNTYKKTESDIKANEKEVQQIFMDRNKLRSMRVGEQNISDIFISCVHVRRVMMNCMSTFGIDIDNMRNSIASDLTITEVIEKVNALCYSLVFMYQSNFMLPERYKNAAQLTSMMIRIQLASKRVIYDYNMSKVCFEAIINSIKLKYQQAIINAGDMVGAVAAQSIGEPSTQLTLNTFHTAGVGNKQGVRSGIPRFKELLMCSSNIVTPTATIFLKPNFAKHILIVKEITNKLTYTTIENFLNTVEVYYDPDPYKSTIESDNKIISDYLKHSIVDTKAHIVGTPSKWLIRLTFNKNIMMLKQMRIDIIKNKIKEYMQGSCIIVASDDNASDLVIRIHLLLNMLSDKDKNDELALINKYKTNIVSKIVLRGVMGLTSVDQRKRIYDTIDNTTGKIETKEEYYMDTDGTNISKLFAIPYIDYTRTISNDVREIEAVLGIEAARTIMFNEIAKVFGQNVGYHHLGLLVDTMTYAGTLTAVHRHGINKLANTPLGKASFEETIEQIRNAALYSQPDNMNGVSGNIMFSQIVRGGTGMIDIVYNPDGYGIDNTEIDELF